MLMIAQGFPALQARSVIFAYKPRPGKDNIDYANSIHCFRCLVNKWWKVEYVFGNTVGAIDINKTCRLAVPVFRLYDT